MALTASLNTDIRSPTLKVGVSLFNESIYNSKGLDTSLDINLDPFHVGMC